MRVVAVAAAVLVAGVAPPARAVDASDGALLTSMVGAAAARDPRVDVLTAADVRKAIDFEAQKTLLGCDTAGGSCLAEVAQAMDARAVLHGNLGSLGGDVVLTLSLFDSQTATAVGRVVVKDKSASAVGDRVEAAVVELLRGVPQGGDGKRVRVLVLDLDVVNAGAADKGQEDAGLPALSMAGLGVAGLGGVSAVVALVAEGFALDADGKLKASSTPATDVDALSETRRNAVTVGRFAWGGAALLVVGGAVLAALPLVLPAE